ncbi:hypothetical protein PV328_009821 [Microctonus aethiopoides]|uniref:Uncharacterized protein n=1 Tax=Microctonus aethiopoides TaxID=144406 RepID=A0AA39EZS7_9HYME|nr:hypothetical protein PV328_009821 [Microctonus aethiopoides]
MYNNNGIKDNYDDKLFIHSKCNNNHRSTRRILREIQINEWTFSLFLFIVSLTIVTSKLIIRYGYDIPSTLENNSSPLMNMKNHLYNIYDIPNILVLTRIYNNKQSSNETLLNTKSIDEYKKSVVYTTIKLLDKYGWLIKATLSGLGILGFTWFIVYKDSNIPGINPPSPFSPSKKKLSDNPRIQMNYLIGVINAILIFIYISLD